MVQWTCAREKKNLHATQISLARRYRKTKRRRVFASRDSQTIRTRAAVSHLRGDSPTPKPCVSALVYPCPVFYTTIVLYSPTCTRIDRQRPFSARTRQIITTFVRFPTCKCLDVVLSSVDRFPQITSYIYVCIFRCPFRNPNLLGPRQKNVCVWRET